MVCYSRLLRRRAPGLPFTACCFRFRTFRGRYHRQWAKTPSALLARGKGWRLRPQTNNQIKPHIWRVVGCLVHTLCRRRPRPRSPPVELYQVGAVRAWDIFFARLAGLAGGRHSRKDWRNIRDPVALRSDNQWHSWVPTSARHWLPCSRRRTNTHHRPARARSRPVFEFAAPPCPSWRAAFAYVALVLGALGRVQRVQPDSPLGSRRRRDTRRLTTRSSHILSALFATFSGPSVGDVLCNAGRLRSDSFGSSLACTTLLGAPAVLAGWRHNRRGWCKIIGPGALQSYTRWHSC